MARGSRGTLAIVVAMLTGLAVAGAKLVGFLLTLSATLLASTAHSLVDAGNEALLLLGRRRARRPATLQNPFGHGRERYFWPFAATVILFCLGGTLAVVEGVRRIGTDDPDGFGGPVRLGELDSPTLIGVAAGGVVLEAVALAVAIRQAKAVKGDTPWPLFLRRSTVPALPIVLVQKTGALVGLALTAAALTTAHMARDGAWDAYGMVAIGGLMVVLAAALAVEMNRLLLGRAASPTDQQRIAAAIEIEPSVTRLLHMRTEHVGPDEMLVGAKIELVHGMTVEDVTEMVGRIEVSVRRAVPAAQVLYLEPDLCRTHLVAGAAGTHAPRHLRGHVRTIASPAATSSATSAQSDSAQASGSDSHDRHVDEPRPVPVTLPATDAAEFAELAESPDSENAADQTPDEAAWGKSRPVDPAPLPVPQPFAPSSDG